MRARTTGARTAAFVDRQTGSIYVKSAPTTDEEREELAELPGDDAIDAFTALLAQRGLEPDWYAYEAAVEEAALRRRAAENRIEIDE